jgi:flagellar motility protein MotE (MotC chaperone)
MMMRILPVIAFAAFASVPFVIGNAETKGELKTETNGDLKTVAKADAKTAKAEAKSEVKTEEEAIAPKKRTSNECLASEEVIQDLDAREKKLKEKELELTEKEKELTAQATAVKEELAKLETSRKEISGAHEKQMAEREEKVNKLMETFESMSPKSAAAVLNGVDDELAVTALSRLTNVKAGKVLANMSPEKSSRLSEIMAFGKVIPGKEKARADTTERNPASKR